MPQYPTYPRTSRISAQRQQQSRQQNNNSAAQPQQALQRQTNTIQPRTNLARGPPGGRQSRESRQTNTLAVREGERVEQGGDSRKINNIQIHVDMSGVQNPAPAPAPTSAQVPAVRLQKHHWFWDDDLDMRRSSELLWFLMHNQVIGDLWGDAQDEYSRGELDLRGLLNRWRDILGDNAAYFRSYLSSPIIHGKLIHSRDNIHSITVPGPGTLPY